MLKPLQQNRLRFGHSSFLTDCLYQTAMHLRDVYPGSIFFYGNCGSLKPFKICAVWFMQYCQCFWRPNRELWFNCGEIVSVGKPGVCGCKFVNCRNLYLC